MQKKKFRNALAILCLATGLSGFVLSEQENSPQDVTEYEKRLADIASQITNLKARIKKEDRKKTSILARLDKIGLSKRLIRKEISMYNVQMEKTNVELAALNKKIPALRSKLDREKDAVAKIMVTMYKYGRLNFLEFLLQAEDMGSLLSENKHLVLLAQNQQNIISDYVSTLNELIASEKQVESKKTEVVELIKLAQQKKQEMDTEEKRSQTLIREIDQNKETHMKAMAELQERAEQLQKLMKKILSSQLPPSITLVPLYEKKGKLPWPISGRIMTYFGLKRHPRFNTKTRNNGIEISPGKTMVVKSVHPGTVVYNDHFRGYGNLLIIDHGMSYYSLYGHCSDFLVNKGDPVKGEQPIAMVGDISSLKGTTLYFEIRYKTKPLNPLQWLKRR
ncbi:murein hydrolase activator EnvC family protein [Acidobacteriota bacterium]